jgi:hypothetical protein
MREQLIPKTDKATLSYGGQSLHFRELLGSPAHLHATEANANCTGGDDNDLMAIFAKADCGFDYKRKDGKVRFMGLFIDYGRGACWDVS